MKDPLKVACLRTVSDDCGTYNIKGKVYDVLSFSDGLLEIEAEPGSGVDSIQIKEDDRDFLVYYGEDD